ncbi:hypothetical protein CVT24_009842 [Panaeolus cyanescens]|uniref:Uncharacterized protein n=1 Tax=Panaeolus cyanescens TaxID=181874 RepID=A0A409VY51_9AGAR|nr:hypothetical protein CVT24_009842 [Panaeolus cyanescens]
MQFALLFLLQALVVSTAIAQKEAPVLTAEQVYQTIIDKPPYMVEMTRTVTWTQSPSIFEPEPTDPPKPSLDPAYESDEL